MTTPIAERVAGPSHGRALSPTTTREAPPDFTHELPRKLLPTTAKEAQVRREKC
jgi:hypothetical protein